MTRFFRSLKSQVAAYRRRSARLNRKPYRETTIRYVWAKECDTSSSSHYHVVLTMRGYMQEETLCLFRYRGCC
jgi:hypothetical protein